MLPSRWFVARFVPAERRFPPVFRVGRMTCDFNVVVEGPATGPDAELAPPAGGDAERFLRFCGRDFPFLNIATGAWVSAIAISVVCMVGERVENMTNPNQALKMEFIHESKHIAYARNITKNYLLDARKT